MAGEAPRPAAGLFVAALIRRIEGEGGHATVLAKGDVTAGAILLVLAERGAVTALVERVLGVDGYLWCDSGPAEPSDRDAYLARRRRSDPDLWVIELDHRRAREIASALLA